MEIATNINFGTVSAEVDVDVDDMSEHLQPYIEAEVENQIGGIDFDDMIRNRMRDGMLDDMISDGIANSSTEVDGGGIAADLLGEYLGRDALGNSDETGCTLASTFEKAVRLANQRNTRSSDGAGIAATVIPAIHGLSQRLVELERIVRRLTMADRNHATATDLISSTLIFPAVDDNDAMITDNTAAILG